MPHNKGKTVGKADRAARNLRNDHCGRLSPTAHVKKQIDKPKGQAGRSELKGGYSLQQAMGLAGNDWKYNAFRDSETTRQTYGDIPLSLLNICYCNYAQAQHKHQYLAKFRDNWLFHDFMGCYLRNHVQYTKKQHPNLDDSEIDESDHITDDGESELSEPPESIHASTPVLRPKSSRSRPTRHGRSRK
ncbi:hypothetical protein EDD22DRAFT_851987 [Suillus occidentalis]|nr:hypothetical protein EDD22DRAFT_851987 [Suillus occidentalis]